MQMQMKKVQFKLSHLVNMVRYVASSSSSSGIVVVVVITCVLLFDYFTCTFIVLFGRSELYFPYLLEVIELYGKYSTVIGKYSTVGSPRHQKSKYEGLPQTAK